MEGKEESQPGTDVSTNCWMDPEPETSEASHLETSQNLERVRRGLTDDLGSSAGVGPLRFIKSTQQL